MQQSFITPWEIFLHFIVLRFNACIQLLAIVKSSVLQEVGPDIVLESFMGDLKLLERVGLFIMYFYYQ